jgi:hypothetical protein
MAVPFSNSKLRVPRGFQGLLEGMAKEILMMQPPDIYAFCAMYFEDLLNQRDGGGLDPESKGQDPAAKVSQLDDRTYNNNAFLDPDVDANDVSQDAAAVIIQTKYRQSQAKTTADELRREKAAIKIQSCARGFVARQKVKTIRADEQTHSIADGEAAAESDEEDEELEKLMSSEAHGEDYGSQAPHDSSRVADEAVDENATARDSRGSTKSSRPVSSVGSTHQAAPLEPSSLSPPPEMHEDNVGQTAVVAAAVLAAGSDDREEEEDQERPAEESDEDEHNIVVAEGQRGCDPESPHHEEIEVVDSDEKEDGKVEAIVMSARSDKHSQDGDEKYEYDSDVDKATSKIILDDAQAAVLGEELQENVDNGEPEMVTDNNDEDYAELEMAATKIHDSGFHGMEVEVSEAADNDDVKATEDLQKDDDEKSPGEEGDAAFQVETGQHWLRESSTVDDEDENEKINMEPEDTNVDDAAMEIQAGFHEETGGADDVVRHEESLQTEEDEMANAVDDPNMEAAVTKIQASFRGYKTRKSLTMAKQSDDEQQQISDSPRVESKLHNDEPVSISDHQMQEEKFEEIDPHLVKHTDYDLAADEAASKIQAGFRGYKTRKELQQRDVVALPEMSPRGSSKADGDDPLLMEESPAVAMTLGDSACADVDSMVESKDHAIDEDVLLNEAATKIQAGFKGYKTRKEFHETVENHEDINEDLMAFSLTDKEAYDVEEREDEEVEVPAVTDKDDETPEDNDEN